MDSDESLMARWNQDALVALQGELKLNVITSTGLTDRLQRAAGGFMDRAEAQAVESKPSNEQMGEVIRILLGKRNADFKIFCRILLDSNYSAWAAQLEKKARKFRGEPGATEHGSQSMNPKQPRLDGAGMMKESQEAEPLSAKDILDLVRKQFLKDVDAQAVVGELRQNGIVPQSCQEKVAKADGFRQRNEILHDCLKRTCTREALIKACDIIIELAEEGSEESNPNMKKVAEDMKKKLGTGK